MSAPAQMPWEKYSAPQSPQEQGPWAKYAQPSTPSAQPPAVPLGDQPASFSGVARTMGSQALDAVKGAGKGALSTVFHLAAPLERATGMEQRINRPEVQAGIAPNGTAQNIGYGAEKAAEFLAPAGLVAKGGRAIEAATASPVLRTIGKTALDSLSTGAVRTAQTGSPTEGLKAAAVTAPVSGAVRAFPIAFPSKEVLGNQFQQVNAAVGKEPVDVSKFAQPAMAARKLNQVTGDTNPVVLRKAFGAIQPSTEPLTFEDARMLQSSAGRRAVQMAEAPRVVSKPMSGHVAQLAKGLGEANSEVAARGGVGPLYESTMAAYGRRQGLESAKDTGRSIAKGLVGKGVATAAGAGLAGYAASRLLRGE